ncbi:radical SAM family heme chaperone HemW [Alteromonas sp. W364]|uniref:radical SAM family heme chaperone HemW n=1 Tax=Alteromonas sp. W364 TaxID=3075610 RepID=UPI00288538B3|nr:radical SAM family heme chaperone HemW [Alteromonas sp. W364]MDT0628954.1 radical SAM family heme chaperone HemW [Alteromonas sp. W364]
MSVTPTPEAPLGMYVHIPWCVQKCPYCDFNSHNLKGGLPETEYVSHLLDDLVADLPFVTNPDGSLREVTSIFIGGGTPSLLSISAMARLLEGIKDRIPLASNAEITMEANPGTVESDKFVGFQKAGITRISVGVQSFHTEHLQSLGRIHDAQQAIDAIKLASILKLKSFNLDLMHGLPGQSVEDAMQDLKTAIALNPPHLSWYQLTIEPNTAFHSKPPTLPDDDVLWEIQEQGHALLSAAGYEQYEISAYAKPGHQCQHNLNYWRFGDYLGIGCGAHGKITKAHPNINSLDKQTCELHRTVKVKHPKGYMDLTRSYLDQKNPVDDDDLAFEFFMNRFRIFEMCPKTEFQRTTGRSLTQYERAKLNKALSLGLIQETPTSWQLTALGKRYLNSLLDLFV